MLETLALSDGRTLAYRVYGSGGTDAGGSASPDPATITVVNCHGGLLDGRDVELADGWARERGIRIVSPDRPGVGGSSPAPGRGMREWADADIRALLDHLGVDRFAVMGWSEGGQYALALAHVFASRVTRAAVIAGALPLDDPSTRAELNRADRRLAALSEHAPALAALYFAAARSLGRALPERFVAASARVLDASDQEVVAANASWFVESALGALEHPRGAADEYRAFVAPWGFAPEDVAVPVDVHQGTDDRLIAPAWSEELVRRLPHATLTLWPAEGHFVAITRRREILSRLVAAD